jgi:biotin operon repressor
MIVDAKGWVKIHRQLADWEWYQDSRMVHLLLHFVIKANHKHQTWQGVDIYPGQFVSGRKRLSVETGLTEMQIRVCIGKLEKAGIITSKTTNKYTLFTLNSWNVYQSGDGDNQQDNQQVTNKYPASNQQVTTNKNDKNVENVENDKKKKEECFFPVQKKGETVLMTEKEIEQYAVDFYMAYPTHRDDGASTSKSRKSIPKVVKAIKGGYDFYLGLQPYLEQSKGFCKNFDTYLNNLPDIETLKPENKVVYSL